MNSYLVELGKKAKHASRTMAILDTSLKNSALISVADSLVRRTDEIIDANASDIAEAKKAGMHEGLVDRLLLNEKRVLGMAEGLKQVAALDDPIGEVLSMIKRPNGLMIGKKRVPLGLIGIIYEARPNVTADAFALCFKAGNAVILKGGSSAMHSNQKIVEIIKDTLLTLEINTDCINLIEDTNRETTMEFMRLNQYVDVLIPRGSASLIQSTVLNSTIPVIETGTGNCHIFVDESADFDMALDIIYNAKTQRIGVCNACESLVVHREIARSFIPLLVEKLQHPHVEIRGDEYACSLSNEILPATEEDWGTEYLDYKISLKIVDNLDAAIAHINQYNTGHSESIITNSYHNANRFLNEIDAAAVYVNASTRFTDGFEFGFGAEIGISTKKLHARGPMGLKELTTTKYIIYGDGQTRP